MKTQANSSVLRAYLTAKQYCPIRWSDSDSAVDETRSEEIRDYNSIYK